MSAVGRQALRHGSRGFSVGVTLVLLLFVLAAGGVAWVYNGMIAQERWPIRWLEIDGQFERVSAEQVRAKLAPLVSGSFFTVNTKAIRETAGDMPYGFALILPAASTADSVKRPAPHRPSS